MEAYAKIKDSNDKIAKAAALEAIQKSYADLSAKVRDSYVPIVRYPYIPCVGSDSDP